jgi:hypothetical protein
VEFGVAGMREGAYRRGTTLEIQSAHPGTSIWVGLPARRFATEPRRSATADQMSL